MNDHDTHTNEPRFVVGFDDTPSGFDALVLGRRLAELTGALLTVVHVYPGGPIAAADAATDTRLSRHLREEALECLDHARTALDGLSRWEAVVQASTPPARGLHAVAEELEADAIVVGSTHRHGLGRVVPGATADRLLHGSDYAVAVAPAGWRQAGQGRMRAIAAGFDGSPESAAALSAAAALARAARAELRPIAVFEPPNPANPIFALTSHGYGEITGDLRDALGRRLDAAVEALSGEVKVSALLVDGDPADVLTSRSGSVDLLALGSRSYGALRSVMLGSLTHELVSRARCPLLIVPRGVEHPLSRLTARRPSAARAG